MNITKQQIKALAPTEDLHEAFLMSCQWSYRASRIFKRKDNGLYKNINDVIAAQTDLVKVLAIFTPKIVRMADANRKEGRED